MVDRQDSPLLVLYVDDESANRVVFEACFGQDFIVSSVDSGEEGLARIQDQDFHVIVADERMPGLTGQEFLKIAAQLRPQTLRILVSAFVDESDVFAAIDAGIIHAFYRKPWNYEALRESMLSGASPERCVAATSG